MNFEHLYDLVGQYQYDEIRIVGKDVTLLGKMAHIAAVMRKNDQIELCLLMQEEPKTKEPKNKDHYMDDHSAKETAHGLQQRHSNRELMRQAVCGQGSLSIHRMEIDGTGLISSSSSCGVLHMGDLGGYYLMEKLADAGWRLPSEHVFFRQDWEKQPIWLMHCSFVCPAEELPDLAWTKVSVTWQSYPVWYQIEQPVRLVMGDVAEDVDGQTKLAFTIRGQDGAAQEGICYINRVGLQDIWKEEEQRFADPEYQKKMLEHLSQEEFEELKQSSLEMLEQICPRGMCFPVVEYECTLDVSLEFYTQDYLNAQPKNCATSITYMQSAKEAFGTHGLRLRSHVLQSPVPPDTQEVFAELFQAIQAIPEWTEELV